MNLPPPSSPPPNELAVVGEHRDDPERLLLRDAEGRYYAYPLPNGDPRPIDPDDEWQIEQESAEELFT